MSSLLRRSTASVAGAIGLALLSLATASAESTSDNTSWTYWATEVFGKTLRDQTAASSQTEWSDFSALGYARSKRSDDVAVRWLPPPMPAVDGINAKIDGYGGGSNHSNGFYGTNGSLSVPLAQQWGLQLDGGVGSDNGIGAYGGAGHLFWRDPSIGLLVRMGLIRIGTVRTLPPASGLTTGSTLQTLVTSAQAPAALQRRVSTTGAD
jgi:hypothetical protein